MRTNVDNEFQDWFKEAKQIATEVGADIKVPRYAHRQQHRANAPADTPLQYFKLNVGIPFLDHIDQEMNSRFCETGQVVIFSCWSRLLYVNARIYIA